MLNSGQIVPCSIHLLPRLFWMLMAASLLCWTPLMARQDPPAATQADTTQSDSLAQPSAADTVRAAPKKRAVLSVERMAVDRVAFHFSPAERINLLYEDTAELFHHLPELRISRSGDLGHYAQVSRMGAPARFTELTFDAVSWPKSLYGQTNLTTVPETLADAVELSPQHATIDLHSAAPRDSRPRTYIEYVKGPFDIDVMRVRFRRSLSPKIQPYLSLNFANSDGQQTLVDGSARGGPFDALRIYLRGDYLLSPEHRLRYRLLSSTNETVVATPYFFEMLPEVLDRNARYKTARVLHSLAFAKAAQVKDSLSSDAEEADLYRFKIYTWNNREESRDNLAGRLIEHRNRILGGSAMWALYQPRLTARAIAKFERHNISSPTIALSPQNLASLQTQVQLRLRRKLALNGEMTALHHSEFDAQFSGLGEVAFSASAATHYYGKFERAISLPGAAEYANELPGTLTANAALEPATLDKFEVGARYQHATVHLRAALNRSALKNGFVLNLADSVLVLQNETAGTNFYGYALMARWQPFTGFRLEAQSTGSFETPASYDFWYVPQQVHRLGLRYGRAFFQRDIRAVLSLSGQYIGRHREPRYRASDAPEVVTAKGGSFVDAELKLLYKDAIIFFRFENLFDEALVWRLSQHMRGRAFRYGINWQFWN